MVINTSKQYNELIERMDREAYISTPIFRDMHLHESINNLLCVGISFLNGDFYIVSISHKDAVTFQINTDTAINAEVCYYLNTNQVPTIHDEYSAWVRDTLSVFSNVKECNRIIPLTQWSVIIRKYHEKLLEYVTSDVVDTKAYLFIDKAIKVLRKIEMSGLAVDVTLFIEHFGTKATKLINNGLVYSQYYPYTTTGRPSNRFGGINFAALNKSDGSRDAFISRFENGSLLQLDFESYHLRLIAEYMGVELPNESIHQYLAKQYFEKDTITQEEYDQSKQITFGILYGADVTTDIPLLQSIKELSKQIYNHYKSNGLRSPYSGRTIHVSEQDATENKLFNYFVQSLEFETTISKLLKLTMYLERYKSKIVLYTYDAVLLDCHPDELVELQITVKNMLEDGKFPIKVHIGPNYGSLK